MAFRGTKAGALRDADWFLKVEDFDIALFSNFISYAVQCLTVVEKWESVVDMCKRFNAATNNHFASFLLPFAIHAETTLYQSAAHNTSTKREALRQRVLAFENWKATSKKRKTRQALLTGEVPQEELDF